MFNISVYFFELIDIFTFVVLSYFFIYYSILIIYFCLVILIWTPYVCIFRSELTDPEHNFHCRENFFNKFFLIKLYWAYNYLFNCMSMDFFWYKKDLASVRGRIFDFSWYLAFVSYPYLFIWFYAFKSCKIDQYPPKTEEDLPIFHWLHILAFFRIWIWLFIQPYNFLAGFYRFCKYKLGYLPPIIYSTPNSDPYKHLWEQKLYRQECSDEAIARSSLYFTILPYELCQWGSLFLPYHQLYSESFTYLGHTIKDWLPVPLILWVNFLFLSLTLPVSWATCLFFPPTWIITRFWGFGLALILIIFFGLLFKPKICEGSSLYLNSSNFFRCFPRLTFYIIIPFGFFIFLLSPILSFSIIFLCSILLKNFLIFLTFVWLRLWFLLCLTFHKPAIQEKFLDRFYFVDARDECGWLNSRFKHFPLIDIDDPYYQDLDQAYPFSTFSLMQNPIFWWYNHLYLFQNGIYSEIYGKPFYVAHEERASCEKAAIIDRWDTLVYPFFKLSWHFRRPHWTPYKYWDKRLQNQSIIEQQNNNNIPKMAVPEVPSEDALLFKDAFAAESLRIPWNLGLGGLYCEPIRVQLPSRILLFCFLTRSVLPGFENFLPSELVVATLNKLHQQCSEDPNLESSHFVITYDLVSFCDLIKV